MTHHLRARSTVAVFAVLALLLSIAPPGALAAHAVAPTLEPTAGTRDVRDNQPNLTFGGTVQDGWTLQSARIEFRDAQANELVRDDVTSRVSVSSGGSISGTVTLNTSVGGRATAKTVRLAVVVTDGTTSDTGFSRDVIIDRTRPQILAFSLVDPRIVQVTFSEEVTSSSGDSRRDWSVEGATVTEARLPDNGDRRIRLLDLFSALDEDAEPRVFYSVALGNSRYTDFAGRTVGDEHNPANAVDEIPPALPAILTVDGVEPGSGVVTRSAVRPRVEVGDVRSGHTVELWRDGLVDTTRNLDRGAPDVKLASKTAGDGTVVFEPGDYAESLPINVVHTLYVRAIDPAGNDAVSAVRYTIDDVRPRALLAVGDGPFVTVEFDEEVIGANRPSEWKLTTGGPVIDVAGSGLSRLVKGTENAEGRITYTPDTAAGNTFRDAAGNQVGAFTLDILSGRTVLANGTTQADEGKALGFLIRLASAQDGPVTASYTTQDGTGVAGLDYVAKSGSVTFQPGETQKLVSVSTLADDLDEADETVILRLTSVQNGEMSSKADRATGTIIDGDPLPEVDVLDVETHEGTTARVKAQLDAISGRDVTVTFATANGTALSGRDYGARSGNLTIAAGERFAEIVIPIEDDGVVEPAETFTVRISNAVNADLGRATATVTILDGIGVDDGIDRVDGPSRTETSAEISKTFWDSSDVVVIATADAYPDALAGAPLASKHRAPILLTGRAGLHPAVRDEVKRLGATKAFVLGGAAALSSKVDDDLRAVGVKAVTRVSGKNRFETSQRIAELVGGTSVYLVEGANADPSRGWPDAVAVSALAAAQQRPILLTEKARFPSETRLAMQRLNPSRVDIVGGTAAVNESVAAAADQVSGTVARISGRTRYETSLAVAEASRKAGLDPENTWVATGDDWPDSLSASPAVARTGGILILVDSTDLNESPPARTWAEKHTPRSITVVGGTKAISQKVYEQLRIVAGL